MSPQNHLGSVRLRALIVLGLLGVGLVLIGVKSARLQLGLGEDLRELAEQQYVRTLRVSAPRGDILDRFGRPLAVSVPVWSVSASPRDIREVDAAAKALATALELDQGRVRSKLLTSRAFVWLRRRVSPEMADTVRALGIDGVALHRESKRFYPGRHLAGQLLGTVSIDGEGQSGVERAADDHLRGRTLALPSVRDNRGRRVLLASGVDVDVLGGDDVHLTLDANLQHMAEDALARGLERTEAKSGMVLVADPTDGALLAVANAPLFNPNNPSASGPTARRNRAFSDVFEPGSTFKMITFAAALDAGTLRPTDQMFCDNGRFRLGKFVVRDLHPVGAATAREVFKVSSNICTLKIAQKLGEPAFRETVGAFGFGERPALGFVEESAGLLPPGDVWGTTRLSTISYGHGISVTGLQLTSAVVTVARGGERIGLRLVDRIESPTARDVGADDEEAPVTAIQPATARTLTEIMTSVFEKGGTGQTLRIAGVKAAGKTGTAEKVDPRTGRYSSELHTSSFVGFAPADDPRVVVVVIVDEPMTVHSGAAAAGPIWKEVIQAALVDQGALARPAASVGSGSAAVRSKAATVAGGEPQPEAAETGPSGKVVPERWRELVGLNARQALKLAWAQRAVVEVAGRGFVTHVEVLPSAAGEAAQTEGSVERIRLVLHPAPPPQKAAAGSQR